NGGVPGGNIRNAFLWDASRVDLDSVTTLESDVLADLGVSNPNAFDGTRDPLLGVFEFNGNDVTLINNHFSSRFGSTPIFGGPQPFLQAGEAEREAQALALNEVVDGILADDPDALVSVLGDLNTFEFTDELAEDLPGVGDEQVLTNLIDILPGDEAYTFVFQGNSQVLDHIFVTDGLLTDAEIDIVHVNNDFPSFASDHEPVVATFILEQDANQLLIGTSGRDNLEGGGGNDFIIGRAGADDLSGGNGDDTIFAGRGNDMINGDDGEDLIRAGGGNDTAFGGDENDIIFGGFGDDTLGGGAGEDFIFGSQGSDTLSGDAGDDFIFGGFGNDVIIGGEGDDFMRGGFGADEFIFAGTFGDDEIGSFSRARDTLSFTGSDLADISVAETADGTVITVTGANTGTVTLLGVFGFVADDLIV
ncbi:MAG: hypothetical protein AAFY59_16505, partial [Pseudomonadota bacterium]